MKCWWCGNEANSAEHKYKKSDLCKNYGPGPYKNEGSLMLVKEGERDKKILGPNSKLVKFGKTMCSNCNNSKSHVFDVEYSKFVSYIDCLNVSLDSRVVLEFERVWGGYWQNSYLMFYRYLVKSICCNVSDVGMNIDKICVDFLDLKSSKVNIFIDWYVSDCYLKMCDIMGCNLDLMGSRDLGVVYRNDGSVLRIEGCIYYKWLVIDWIYDFYREFDVDISCVPCVEISHRLDAYYFAALKDKV